MACSAAGPSLRSTTWPVVRVPGHGSAIVAMHVQGQPFVSYAADAVVVRVADRLDGLQLLGGRADCQPGNGGLMVTPAAPHSANNRGVLISARELVVLEILPASGRLAVEVDGVVAGYASPGERIGLRPRPAAARVVRLGHTTFYQRARRKLRLTDSAEIQAGWPDRAAEATAARPPAPPPPPGPDG